ncbi:helix-turn-helix domain-containing protein [Cupriavidus necator]|uniref:helix-turn-helix domain-containing protein n=1 Tax=Cupriavidus necator TaxID=106590 RepID=UPI000674FF6A|nr:helix-turn-helix transcriptional regulator [Cupriavidus necator]MDX6007259.1 helix-turn-helix transcriptional regulator [Cupriavidus necator]
MKVSQSSVLSPELAQQAAHVGWLLARLRQARHIKQADAAVRAGLSRNTAYRIEKGDPGLAFGQMLEYLMEAAERIEDGLPVPANLELISGTASATCAATIVRCSRLNNSLARTARSRSRWPACHSVSTTICKLIRMAASHACPGSQSMPGSLLSFRTHRFFVI